MIVYLNGAFLPIEEARISGPRPRLHLRRRRLRAHPGVPPPAVPAAAASRPAAAQPRRHTASRIRTPTPNGTSIIGELVARQPFDDQGVYFQVTRGVAKRDHAFPAGRRADRVHDEQPAGHAVGRAGRAGRRRGHRRGQPLAALRSQDDIARRQRADAPACRRRRRGRDGDVPRRLPDRGVGVERPRRDRRRQSSRRRRTT